MARNSRTTIDLTAAQQSEPARAGDITSREAWLQRSRVVLSPIAPPSVLGLFGFFTATVLFGTNIAGWWGTDTSSVAVFPFALAFGGVTQILACMWSFKARDGLAVAVHGTWGSFWIGYGILNFLYVTGVTTPLPHDLANPGLGIWFVPVCAITTMAALAALGDSLGLFAVFAAAAGGSGILAAGLWAGSPTADHVAGWFLVVAAAAAWYVGSAMMVVSATGRTVLPLGKYRREANVPLAHPVDPFEYAFGEPGVRARQ